MSARKASTAAWQWMGYVSGAGLFLVAVILFFALAYILGRPVLVGSIGNDSPLHIANTEWFDRYLPEIPDWFPLHGGGMSIQRSYPIAAYLLVAGLHRISDLSIVQAYRLVGFLTIPLTAVGLYLFSLGSLRNRTIGLIAGVLFILSPVSWSWIFEQGYIATTLAMVALPIIFMSFERFLSSLHNPQRATSTLWFVCFAFSLAASAISHAVVAASAVVGIGLYFVVRFLLGLFSRQRGGRGREIKPTALAGISAAAVAAYWLVPVMLYGQVANREGLNTYSASSIPKPSLAELFSFKPLDATEWEWFRNSSLPLVVGVLFLIGALFALRYSRTMLAFSAAGLGAVGYLLMPSIAIALTGVWGMWPLVFRTRSFVVLMSVVFPFVAAFGAWAVARTILNPVDFLRFRKVADAPKEAGAVERLRRVLESLASLAVSAVFVVIFRNASSVDLKHVNYGVSRDGFNVLDIWGKGSEAPSFSDQLTPKSWPPFHIEDDDGTLQYARDLAGLLPDEELLRIDISPHQGKIAQSLAVYANASQMNTYIFNGNLNHAMWAYQVNVFFNQDPPPAEYGTPTALNEAAQWFGIEYVYLRPEFDPADMYAEAGWERIMEQPGLQLWRYPGDPDYAALSTRPLVLVISQEDIRGFEQVFRSANRGAITEAEAWLVQGEDLVDNYSVEELQQFDAVILHGYTYKDSVVAWATLEEYVRAGGALYVDTGWQWTVPEWEFLFAPQVLPVPSLKWTYAGEAAELNLPSPEISGALDPSGFGPLTWEGGPWAFSSSPQADLREWGRLVLSAGGKPLVVAGQYGDGKVIWSGMNLIAHANDKSSDEEFRLIHNLMRWLLPERVSNDLPVQVARQDPDLVRFSIEPNAESDMALLWRESFYPAWHAQARDEQGRITKLSVLRAGPGFMLMPLDGLQGETVVTLEWKTPLPERFAAVVSVGSITLLGIAFLDSVAFDARLQRGVFRVIGRRTTKQKNRGQVSWMSDLEPGPGVAEGTRPAPNGAHLPPSEAIGAETDFAAAYELEDDTKDAATISALWESLQHDGGPASQAAEGAEAMIGRWRRRRGQQ